jgi:hypothetical protein
MSRRVVTITALVILELSDRVDDDLLHRRLSKGVDYGLESAFEDSEGRVTQAQIDIQL